MPRQALLEQVGPVALVHGEDVVVFEKIGLRHPPRPLGIHRDATTPGGLDGPGIRGFAHVVGMGAGRVDYHLVREPHLGEHPLEDALCRRRAADVAHADEQYPDHDLASCIPCGILDYDG